MKHFSSYKISYVKHKFYMSEYKKIHGYVSFCIYAYLKLYILYSKQIKLVHSFYVYQVLLSFLRRSRRRFAEMEVRGEHLQLQIKVSACEGRANRGRGG